jgi:hypothetical protein
MPPYADGRCANNARGVAGKGVRPIKQAFWFFEMLTHGQYASMTGVRKGI